MISMEPLNSAQGIASLFISGTDSATAYIQVSVQMGCFSHKIPKLGFKKKKQDLKTT